MFAKKPEKGPGVSGEKCFGSLNGKEMEVYLKGNNEGLGLRG